MLRNLLIFSVCLVAVRASGEFYVISSPKSVSFTGDYELSSTNVGDVLNVALGNAISENVMWPGLEIKDPFNLAKQVTVVLLDDAKHIGFDAGVTTYSLGGNGVSQSLTDLINDVEENKGTVCEMDLRNIDEGMKSFQLCVGDVPINHLKETENLNSELHSADKDFMKSLSLLNAISSNFASMQRQSQLIIVRLSLQGLAEAHGQSSNALTDARRYVSSLVSSLSVEVQKATKNRALVVAIANKSSGTRTKREALEGSATNKYNLAEYYNEDYPVIFNIILWFMVTFGLALLAICYAIGSMDPGRDSIIYRMTSTRMKKDN